MRSEGSCHPRLRAGFLQQALTPAKRLKLPENRSRVTGHEGSGRAVSYVLSEREVAGRESRGAATAVSYPEYPPFARQQQLREGWGTHFVVRLRRREKVGRLRKVPDCSISALTPACDADSMTRWKTRSVV